MQQMTAKLLETKMFRGTRSVSRSSNRDDSTSEETQMVTLIITLQVQLRSSIIHELSPTLL